MSSGRASWCRWALPLLAVLAARSARAAPSASYDLDYIADAGCPARASFAAWVDAQLREARETTPEERAHAVVRLRQSATGATASFALTRGDGGHYERALDAESCDAAAQGLAFVLAYALGGGDPANAQVPEIKPEQALPAAPEVARERAAVAPPSASPAPAPAPAPAPVPAERNGWRFGLAAQLGARGGLAPIWTPIEAGLLELRRSGVGVLAPTLRAGLVRAEPVTRLDAFGSTTFSWLSARVEACPLRWPLLQILQAVPCLAAHVGRLRALGRPSVASGGVGRRANELWADATVALRLELTLWRVLQLEAQGDVVVPVTRYSFAFDNPNTPVYQVQSLALAGSLGLGVHFP